MASMRSRSAGESAATRAPPRSRIASAARPGWRRVGHRLGGQRLDLEPDAEAVLRRPDGGHRRAGVAGNHGCSDHIRASAMYGAGVRAAIQGPWMPHASLLNDLVALFQVVLIDLTLAGDNAVVVGLAVAGLPRRGSGASPSCSVSALPRRCCASRSGAVTLQLLAIVGLLLAGGLLLLWVVLEDVPRTAPPSRPRGSGGAGEDAARGHHADRARRCVDEPGQRARGGRRGRRPSLGAGRAGSRCRWC